MNSDHHPQAFLLHARFAPSWCTPDVINSWYGADVLPINAKVFIYLAITKGFVYTLPDLSKALNSTAVATGEYYFFIY